MAQPPQSRSILAMILRNFISSLKPRQVMGDLKGTDYFGTRYFEIPADPSRGKRRPNRWFVPTDKENFQQDMPAEWEAWLRFRRNEPPTEEEVMRNLAIIEMKKKNAIEVDKKAGKMTPLEKGMETFPKRPEYEVVPGVPKSQNQ